MPRSGRSSSPRSLSKPGSADNGRSARSPQRPFARGPGRRQSWWQIDAEQWTVRSSHSISDCISAGPEQWGSGRSPPSDTELNPHG